MGWLQTVILEVYFSGQPAGNPKQIRMKINWLGCQPGEV